MRVDLSKRPFYLEEEDIKWVKNTIKNMTLEEKIGQLFVNMGSSREEAYLKETVEKYHIGAIRYNPGSASEIYDQNKYLQSQSKIPILIAANTEQGGKGAVSDGTEIGFEVKIAATNDPKYAYEMGRVSGYEASAVGCNWSFAPIVDIMYNWRNPIIAKRSWSNDPKTVLELSLEYMRGIQEYGIMPAAKHFPGDGVDERDHHLSPSINSLSMEEWDKSFGYVYQRLVDNDLPSIMAGHIHLPSYSRHFNPEKYKDRPTMPASLSKEILMDLLRGKLGFNGVVVTDASHMVGMTGAMKRSEILPTAIESGCDLFLFFNDPDEDFGYMLDGYKNGLLSEERLNDAITRTLGLKAKIGLHKKTIDEMFLPKEEAMARIGEPHNVKLYDEVTDKSITLVKEEEGVLPISPEKFKRVLIVDIKGEEGGFGAMLGGGFKASDKLLEVLKEKGYQVEKFISPIDRIKELPPTEMKAAVANVYAQKAPIKGLTDNYDLIINVVDVNPGTVQRPVWPASKGTPDIPFYVHEVPTIVISVQCPYHLADIPQAKTYINTYDSNDRCMEILAEKLEGNSEFKGVSKIDVFCGNLLDF